MLTVIAPRLLQWTELHLFLLMSMYIENHSFASIYSILIKHTGCILVFSLFARLKMPLVCNQSPIYVLSCPLGRLPPLDSYGKLVIWKIVLPWL